ncbi:MAG: hypothetical protein A3G32_05290 [Deltaproteobacteria bacterium RIFCSPLOWO2_12_FULL_40_28]|nr:MAG: hypothetical protein A3C45_09400 [Deltaproteobacteria bacterium RIFCSPHIGHO2_02_FULL_40_28]OGQ19775.1 MAG: hypothetical protein A3E27_08595 [Deltaproteobacteria bacterium RIFCSPHIGHO2_12_FULL_40_32]OGQ41052.1 MAG: hypothetical protein A3I69_04010 [Deltaproteobacteria bacterium RIFCSPLOWO2_02_FULL_40_36]OGQ54168.1 MAG: hypothetical protein A3G32_05290 [Deltaproteobacteria bacterium RIFCSPLOWO2_12_FULL_40_28]
MEQESIKKGAVFGIIFFFYLTISPAQIYSYGNASLSIEDISVIESESNVFASFTLTLTNRHLGADTISMNYTTTKSRYQARDEAATEGEDYQAASGTVTFGPGETKKTVTITIIGDTLDEKDETFYFKTSNVDTDEFHGEWRNGATATIIDNDTSTTTDSTDNDGEEESNTEEEEETVDPAECKVSVKNFVTGEKCADSPLTPDGYFTLSCSPSKLVDPDDPTKVRIIISAVCEGITIEKYYESDASGQNEFAIGQADIHETLSLQLLKSLVEDENAESLNESALKPQCLQSTLSGIFSASSKSDEGNNGTIGVLKEIMSCFMAHRVVASQFGYKNYPELMTSIIYSRMSDATIEDIAWAYPDYCSNLTTDEVREGLQNSQNALPDIGSQAHSECQ